MIFNADQDDKRIFSGGASPDELHYVTLNVTSNELCASMTIIGPSITDDMICAGDNQGFNDRDACQVRHP